MFYTVLLMVIYITETTKKWKRYDEEISLMVTNMTNNLLTKHIKCLLHILLHMNFNACKHNILISPTISAKNHQ